MISARVLLVPCVCEKRRDFDVSRFLEGGKIRGVHVGKRQAHVRNCTEKAVAMLSTLCSTVYVTRDFSLPDFLLRSRYHCNDFFAPRLLSG